MHISVCLMELSFLKQTYEVAKTKWFVSLVVVTKEKPMVLWVSENLLLGAFIMMTCFNS